jgi:hypothetical protein
MALVISAQAQFAPQAGQAGTTALAADSSLFVAWAKGCTIHRGYRDIAVPDSGYATVGDSSSAIGMATQNGVVSLGDGGEATLTFAHPITNGTGFDFAVFENGFTVGGQTLAFLELAFVEVSSDGLRYVRFPATSHIQDTTQVALAGTDCSLINNLAGKYTYGYGTPFDLYELKDSTGIDINHITHVKVIDVVGTITPTHASRDAQGHIINDPYPTNFTSSGFDLDAVGVIHQQTSSGIENVNSEELSIYPNPTSDILNINATTDLPSQATLYDITGKAMVNVSFNKTAKLNIQELPTGLYHLTVVNSDNCFSKTILKQ